MQHSFFAVPEDVDVNISSYIDNPNITMFTIEEYDNRVTILNRDNETLTVMKVFLWPSPNESLQASMTDLHCDAVISAISKSLHNYKDTNLTFTCASIGELCHSC